MLDYEHFFPGKPNEKGCEGSRGQGCCMAEVKCQGSLLGSGGGGAHFIKAGEAVGVTWGLVGRGRGEGVWYRVFSGEG